MMKDENMKKFINVITILLILFMVCACEKEDTELHRDVEEIYEYVFDAGTYSKLDYDYAHDYFVKEYDNYGGKCSAIAKTLDNGQLIVGRNMDLNISNKCAYVVRTKVDGCYETLGLAYTFRDISPEYNDVKEKGLNGEFTKVLPFMCDDVLNTEGLYVEINMRNGEFWPTGEPKFSCSGTNPESDQRVYMFELPRYIGEHCATVDEAIEYVKTLDVYSKDGYWNYCFLLADATGHYGVLEFAMDTVIWNDYQQCQTNFYVNEDIQSIEELKCGVGRYDYLIGHIDEVESETDMFNLMDDVSYYQIYDPSTCKFDVISEDVGALPFASYDFVVENREIVTEIMQEYGNLVRSLSREQQQAENEYWESSFTEVINCNYKTLYVRFFENESKELLLSFD